MHELFHSIVACGLPEYVLSQHLFFLDKKPNARCVQLGLVQWVYAGHGQKAEVISHILNL